MQSIKFWKQTCYQDNMLDNSGEGVAPNIGAKELYCPSDETGEEGWQIL